MYKYVSHNKLHFIIQMNEGRSMHKRNYFFESFFFFKLGFTPCKAEQPLQGVELQEKEEEKGK